MKNMKQIIAVVLVLALVAAASVSITVAYLTDRDAKANVFTIGDVSIKLHEDFDQGATLIPGEKIEKKPVIENSGKNEAWVWATIAIPSALDAVNDASKNIVHFNYTKESIADGLWSWTDASGAWRVETTDINGISYNVYTVLYGTALKHGETTAHPVMTQVYLDTHIDIDPDGNMCWIENGVASKPVWNVKENAYPVIYVSAYGIQKESFDTVEAAYAAYQKQWGPNGTEYADSVVSVSNLEEWNGALGNITYINVTETIDTESDITVEAGKSATVNLGDNALSGTYFETNGEATLENGTLKTGTPAHYAAIAEGADAELVLNDVDVESEGGGIGAGDGAEVTINGGSVAVNTASTSGRYNVYAVGNGTVVTINGGEYSFSKTLNQKRAYVYAADGATVIITGGTFGAASTRSGYTAGILTGTGGTVIIKGGTFGFDPSAWVADGYEAVTDGTTWTVQPKVAP